MTAAKIPTSPTAVSNMNFAPRPDKTSISDRPKNNRPPMMMSVAAMTASPLSTSHHGGHPVHETGEPLAKKKTKKIKRVHNRYKRVEKIEGGRTKKMIRLSQLIRR